MLYFAGMDGASAEVRVTLRWVRQAEFSFRKTDLGIGDCLSECDIASTLGVERS